MALETSNLGENKNLDVLLTRKFLQITQG